MHNYFFQCLNSTGDTSNNIHSFFVGKLILYLVWVTLFADKNRQDFFIFFLFFIFFCYII